MRDVPDLVPQRVVVVHAGIETVHAPHRDEELERIERAGGRGRAERRELLALVALRHPVAGDEQRRELLERKGRFREAPHRTAAAKDVGERDRRELAGRERAARESGIAANRARRTSRGRYALGSPNSHTAWAGGDLPLR